ncbi:MAG: FAD-dependent oxidoreductase [Flavobacteriales bacterium]|nr:FAD-dependent oxidoreductase [Flavobacteriales bacterium]
MKKKQIAIIGGGGAGAAAAWSLSTVHDVNLFEAENSLGGHAYSELLEVDGKIIPVDMGVEYFSEKTAPNLFALHRKLKIETFVAPLAFSAYFPKEKSYWTNGSCTGSLWKELRDEFDKFHIQMHEVMHKGDLSVKRQTLGEFLEENKYSDKFINKGLLPLMTSFSSCRSPLLEYSLTLSSLSFSMGLLSFFHPTYWRKSCVGINGYLKIIEKELGTRVHTNSPVEKVKRSDKGVSIFFKDGKVRDFDEVIFATHADTTLSLLETPTPEEKNILGGFKYSQIKAVLHTDKNVLPEIPCKRTYLEYIGLDEVQSPENGVGGSLNRILNHLDVHTDLNTPIIVTYDPITTIKESHIIKEQNWKIPNLRPKDMLRKLEIRKIQGKLNTWFCGTDTVYTGHEGAILSGLAIADALGAAYPFENDDWAKIQFGVVKGLMGVYSNSEKLNDLFGKAVHKTARLLGLHKSQISRVLLDMYA